MGYGFVSGAGVSAGKSELLRNSCSARGGIRPSAGKAGGLRKGVVVSVASERPAASNGTAKEGPFPSGVNGLNGVRGSSGKVGKDDYLETNDTPEEANSSNRFDVAVNGMAWLCWNDRKFLPCSKLKNEQLSIEPCLWKYREPMPSEFAGSIFRCD
mmetsp:Transcript_31546/g.122166  ORF Transcript_31546/g.122166 Transcript_31546/m.122166 type:complete len:156 (+) Transcript_31546:316-783(+)